MDANGGIQARILVGEFQHFPTGFQVYRRGDDPIHPGLGSADDNRVPSFVIAVKVQMAVGINHSRCSALSNLTSASTIIWISCSNVTSGSQPILVPALLGSPTSKSTSA